MSGNPDQGQAMSDFSTMPGIEALQRCTFTDEQAEVVSAVLCQAEALAVITGRALEAIAVAAANGEDVARELALLSPTLGDLKRWLWMAGCVLTPEAKQQQRIARLH